MTTIYTMREFLERLIATENLDTEIKEYAIAELDKMNERNEKRKNTPTKKQRENEELKKEILEFIKNNGETDTRNVGEKMNCSSQKATALLKQLVTGGKIKSKVAEVDGKCKKVFFISGGETEATED